VSIPNLSPEIGEDEIRDAFVTYVHEVGDQIDGAVTHFFSSDEYIVQQVQRIQRIQRQEATKSLIARMKSMPGIPCRFSGVGEEALLEALVAHCGTSRDHMKMVT
jgi:hypothetical protein